MSINPRDYDLDELRKMARKRGGQTNGGSGGEPDGGRSAEPGSDIGIGNMAPDDVGGGAAGSSFRSGIYRELLPLEAGAGNMTKPYLRSLPQEYVGEHLIFEWLEFLLLHAGYQGATEALSYYESVDWITEDVESALKDYLLGIEDTTTNEVTDLDVDDHMLSLVYIAKLASMR